MQLEQPSPWNNLDTIEWERAFSIPTILWAQAFIPLLGLPKAMSDTHILGRAILLVV